MIHINFLDSFLLGYSWYTSFIAVFIPLVVVALGSMFTERGGVVNIALEGIMVLGGFVGYLFLYLTQKSTTNPYILFLIGAFIAVLGGIIVAVTHAVTSINLGANQIISATAINILSTALVVFLVVSIQSLGHSGEILSVDNVSKYDVSAFGWLGQSNSHFSLLFFRNFSLSIPIGIAVIFLSYFTLYKTRFGLRLRACGENPQAVDVAGISVYKYRWAGVLISGALAGLGGFFLISSTFSAFNGTVAGYGFLAIAIMIFGQWKPLGIVFATIAFVALQTTANIFSVHLGNYSNLINLLPYFLTLIILAIFSRSNAVPKADGLPYIKNKSK